MDAQQLNSGAVLEQDGEGRMEVVRGTELEHIGEMVRQFCIRDFEPRGLIGLFDLK